MASSFNLEVHDVHFVFVVPEWVYFGSITGGMLVFGTKPANEFFGSNMVQFSRNPNSYAKIAQAVENVMVNSYNYENYQFIVTPEKNVILNPKNGEDHAFNFKLRAIYKHLSILIKTPEQQIGASDSLQVYFYNADSHQVHSKEILDRVEADTQNHSYNPTSCNCNK